MKKMIKQVYCILDLWYFIFSLNSFFTFSDTMIFRMLSSKPFLDYIFGEIKMKMQFSVLQIKHLMLKKLKHQIQFFYYQALHGQEIQMLLTAEYWKKNRYII